MTPAFRLAHRHPAVGLAERSARTQETDMQRIGYDALGLRYDIDRDGGVWYAIHGKAGSPEHRVIRALTLRELRDNLTICNTW